MDVKKESVTFYTCSHFDKNKMIYLFSAYTYFLKFMQIFYHLPFLQNYLLAMSGDIATVIAMETGQDISSMPWWYMIQSITRPHPWRGIP